MCFVSRVKRREERRRATTVKNVRAQEKDVCFCVTPCEPTKTTHLSLVGKSGIMCGTMETFLLPVCISVIARLLILLLID